MWIGKHPKNANVSQDFCPWLQFVNQSNRQSISQRTIQTLMPLVHQQFKQFSQNNNKWCHQSNSQSFSQSTFQTFSYSNPGRKSLGQYCNIHIFLSFLSSLIKQCILFEIFLQFSLPSHYTKLKLGKKFWTHASNIVCGVREGAGPVWIGKRPRNAKVSQDFCSWL